MRCDFVSGCSDEIEVQELYPSHQKFILKLMCCSIWFAYRKFASTLLLYANLLGNKISGSDRVVYIEVLLQRSLFQCRMVCMIIP